MAVDIIGKIVVVDTLKQILEMYSGKRVNNNLNIANAISAIQLAIIKSRNFITNTGYETNDELVILWHDAFKKVIAAKIDEDLPKYLYDKAKFWGNPQHWIDNPSTLELVPKLNFLDEQCEMLLKRLKK